jgi:hypothetical protein
MFTIRKDRIKITLILSIATILTIPEGVALSKELRFDDRVDAGSYTLVKKGTGVLRYLRFIEAYAGALYTLPGLDPRAVLTDTPKRLEVEYFHAIKGEDFGPATYKGMARFLNDEEIDRLRDRIEFKNSLYVDVEPGDRYAITYVPGVGTELSLNGQTRGIIEGQDFASALFALWLGEKPFDKRFKADLLGLDG